MKYKKKDMINIIKTLIGANENVLKIDENKNYMELLTQSQELAIILGTNIENNYLENVEIVRELEEYCECIYEMSTKKNKYERKKINEKIRKKLNTIEKKIQLIKEKKEIVFLPYKMSMWDSLESIWIEAINDEDSIVKVIPIPYYEKTPDGEFGKFMYEGELFSEIMNILSWEEYDISREKPDVIYIHNPYDDFNKVTSIHPKFYAKELAKYTNMLVYVPYFITIDDKIDSHFCVLPGTLYSNKVVVQSEEIRKQYIKELNDFKERNGFDNLFGDINDKIVALGHPKYDKIKGINKIKSDIPDDWKNKIYNKYGKKKIIIFYNTTITGLLAKSEEYIRKIKEVIEFFSKTEEMILLWRPHPLFEATLSALQPNIRESYELIVDNFIKEDIGIFDKSSDLYRAISISDIYYGDNSSVVELFNNTEKPVIIQNIEKYGLDIGFDFYFYLGMCIYEGYLYGILFDRNIVLRIDLVTYEVQHFLCLEGMPMNKLRMYHYIEVNEDKMYFIPFEENTIIVYDLKNKEFSKICLELKEELMNANRGNFYGCHFFENKMYLIPFGYRAIIYYDFEKNETIQTIDLKGEFPIEKNDILFSRYVVYKEYMILPTLSSNKILIYNIRTNNYEIKSIGNEEDKYSGIREFNAKLYIVLKNKFGILEWDIEKNEVVLIDDFPEGSISSEKSCFDDKSIIIWKDYLYCFAAKSNLSIKINLISKKIERIDSLNEYIQSNKIDKEISVFDGFTQKENKVYLHYQLDELILEYNLDTNKVLEISRKIEERSFQSIKMKEEYIKNLIYYSKINFNNYENINAGKRIHNYIKNL